MIQLPSRPSSQQSPNRLPTDPKQPPTAQAVRTGKSTKSTHSIIVKEFKDPQGFTVRPNITGVLVNQGELACTCRATATTSCKCIPDAQILDNGQRLQVVPMVSPNLVLRQTFNKGGRVYRVRFDAMSRQTGLGCTGEVEVCVIKQKAKLKGGTLPPKCEPFNSTFTVRNAGVCSGTTLNRAENEPLNMAKAWSRLANL